MARDYAAERAGRDAKWQAEGYKGYNERETARRRWVQKGDASGLKGSDAADPAALIKKAQNVQGVASVTPSKKKPDGERRLPGGRSVDAVARRAEIQGKAIEVRYTLNSKNGIAVAVTLEPGEWTYTGDGLPAGNVRVFVIGGMVMPDGVDFPTWLDWAAADAAERYVGMSSDDVLKLSITAVDPAG